MFHCEGCNTCKTGGRENSYHCPKCNICLVGETEETHKCVKVFVDDDCAICLRSMKNSTTQVIILVTCNHAFHEECFEKYACTNNLCPVCRTKMYDDNELDEEWLDLTEEELA